MLKRLFILLAILLLSSMLWWPSVADDLAFYRHAQLQIADTAVKLESFLARIGLNPVHLPEGVSRALDAFTSGDFLPERAGVGEDAGMDDFVARVFASPYFISLRAMAELTLIRAVLALIWFAALCPILLAVIFDAWVVRRLKYESFAVHHPTLYQAALSAPTLLIGIAFMIMMIPALIPSWVAAAFYLAFLLSIHVIVSQFHRFG